VTVVPKDKVPDPLLWAVQGHGIVIGLQFVVEGGEEALHHGVVPEAALGRHAASDLSACQQLAVGRRPVLTALIGVDQMLIRFDLAIAQSPVEGLKHQRALHGGAQGPTDQAAAVQVNPDSQVQPPCCGADVNDDEGPATIGGCWVVHLLQHVLNPAESLVPLLRPGLNNGQVLTLNAAVRVRQGGTVAAHLEDRGPELLMDPW
jgi:hypothetical protein